MSSPVLLVMAGPNGSGKSTITSEFKPIGEYVNADNIQKKLNCAILEAAQIAENTREYFLSEKKDFTFETVLSTERNYNLMKKAKDAGYIIICIFVLTHNPNINVERVKIRVASGGHNVPEDKIINRYYKAVKLFPKLFDLCDELYVYDNSDSREKGTPKRIIKYSNGELELIPNKIWSENMIKELCNGRYSPDDADF